MEQLDFDIPSLHDGTRLQCRIHFPHRRPSNCVKAGLLVHPYALMGGNHDSVVIQAAATAMMHQGYIVGTFNLRGAGQSEGTGTWTGRAEIEDLISFTGFLVLFVCHLQSVDSLKFLLGGCSYGTILLANAPSIDQILQRFQSSDATSSELFQMAKDLASDHARKISDADLLQQARSCLEPSYLYISPVNYFVSKLLTGFCAQRNLVIRPGPTLIILGDRDSLQPSSSSLERMRYQSPSRICRIAGAGHFWQEAGVLTSMQAEIRAWLDLLEQNP